MRRVVAYEWVSLDGVAEEPSDFVHEIDDGVVANLGEVIATQDLVLLGRTTYDSWASYWPTSDIQPFAGFINGTPKHVATSNELTPHWQHSEAVTDDVAGHVARLRQGEGGDIGVHGSLTLLQGLLAADLVDDLRLVIAPSIAGRGRPLLQHPLPASRWELVSSAATATGVLLVHHRRRVEPPAP